MKCKYFLAIGFLLSSTLSFAAGNVNAAGQANVISTAVPFLNIIPESRGGGMGNVGAATSSDANSMYYNPAKYALGDQTFGAAVSYTPWLRQLVNDISLSNVSGFYKFNKMTAVAASLRYFSMGEINFTNDQGAAISNAHPNEWAFDVALSRMLSEKFSGSVALRYIRSDLYNGMSTTTGEQGHAGSSYAADVAFYYLNKTRIGGLKTAISAGINFSNMGSQISYDDVNKEFIPANLRLGFGYKVDIDEFNSVSLNMDFNKLMVPTPDTTKTFLENVQKNKELGITSSIFKSFSDAPGGFKEELQEITISTGAEYWYNNVFAARAGYFHENEFKGNRKFFTAGAGLKFNLFQIDCSYIIPVAQNNPLANTIRFTLSFDLSQYGRKGL